MSVRHALLGVASIFLLCHCGGAKKLSREDLTVALVPSEVSIQSGTTKSCTDKRSGATTGSVSQYWFTVNSFRLKWTNATDILTITSIKVTLTGNSITGKFEKEFTGEELEELIGFNGATIRPEDVAAATPSETCTSACIEMLSDNANSKPRALACGMSVGGLTRGTGSFSASGTVDVIGYVMTSNNEFQNFRISKPLKVKSND